MEGEGKFRVKEAAAADVLPRGRGAISVYFDDFCETLVESGSFFFCNSLGFNIQHSDRTQRFVSHL